MSSKQFHSEKSLNSKSCNFIRLSCTVSLWWHFLPFQNGLSDHIAEGRFILLGTVWVYFHYILCDIITVRLYPSRDLAALLFTHFLLWSNRQSLDLVTEPITDWGTSTKDYSTWEGGTETWLKLFYRQYSRQLLYRQSYGKYTSKTQHLPEIHRVVACQDICCTCSSCSFEEGKFPIQWNRKWNLYSLLWSLYLFLNYTS